MCKIKNVHADNKEKFPTNCLSLCFRLVCLGSNSKSRWFRMILFVWIKKKLVMRILKLFIVIVAQWREKERFFTIFPARCNQYRDWRKSTRFVCSQKHIFLKREKVYGLQLFGSARRAWFKSIPIHLVNLLCAHETCWREEKHKNCFYAYICVLLRWWDHNFLFIISTLFIIFFCLFPFLASFQAFFE